MVAVGALLSLLALLRPIRKRAQNCVRARITTLFILGSLSFILGLGLAMWMIVFETEFDVKTAIIECYGPHGFELCPERLYGPNIDLDGLWIRLMVPPYLRKPYGSKDEHEWVIDYLVASGLRESLIRGGSLEQHRYWKVVLRVLALDVLVNVVLVWLFTRPRPQPQVSCVETSS